VERRVLLVVDAHVGRRGELRRLLARTAVAVVHAEDPPDAVLRLEESKPDLVVVAGEDHGAATQTLALLSEATRTSGALLYVADPRQRSSWPAVDGVLPLPLTVATLDAVWREVTARRAADFADRAMEISLDDGFSGAGEEAMPVAAAAPSDAPESAPRADKTNVGDEPAGLQEVRAQAGVAPPEEDVFASGPGAVPPAPSAAETEPTDATRNAPTTAELSGGDDRTLVPPPIPRLVAGPRLANGTHVAVARVVRLDAPIPPRAVELSSSPMAGQPGIRVLEAGALGDAASARLLRLFRVLDVAHYYDLLGVARRASLGEITQAFQQVSLEFHPDRVAGINHATTREVVRAVYQRLAEAFRTLRDPTTRAIYDQTLEGKRPPQDHGVEVVTHRAPPEEAESSFQAAAPKPPAGPPAHMAEPLIRRDTIPQVPVISEEEAAPVRPALQSQPTAATRAAAAAPPKPGPPRARQMAAVAPPPAAPDLPPLSEDTATTAGGKKFMRLAAQAMARADLNGARLNLTFALGYEPDNTLLKKRLSEVESRLPRAGTR
jgi:hypothetical protein